MKGITVQQPWAHAIVHLGKHTENRTNAGVWRPALNQRIAIHAGKRFSQRGAQSAIVREALYGRHDVRTPHQSEFPAGAIIGTAFLADVHPEADCCKPWGERSYVAHGGEKRVDIVHLVLEDVRALPTPVECRGALGLWMVADETLRELELVSR
jgi:hypothetical protein